MVRVMDEHAGIQWDDHASAGAAVAEARPEIDRGPLRELLLDSLHADTVVWDSHFVSMERKGTGWRLQFKNGQTAYADLVIGADGAHSRMRPYLTDIKPVYSGVTIVEGNIYHAAQNAPVLSGIVRGGKVFALGGGQTLILSAKGDGSLSFYTGCKVPEDWATASGIDFSDKQQVQAWFSEAYGGWSEAWQELFHGDEMWCMVRPQYHYEAQQWPVDPTLTLIGDAAHRMPPYAGEGVNMAMQDAWELAECLTSSRYATLADAISAYQEAMLRRADAVTRMTMDSTEMLHSAGAVEKLIALFRSDPGAGEDVPG